MKTKILLLFFGVLGFFCCKKRIPVELPTSEPGTIESLTANGKSWIRPNMNLTVGGGIEYCRARQTYIISCHNLSVSNDSLSELLTIAKLRVGRTGRINLNNPFSWVDCDTVPSIRFDMITGRDLLFASYSPNFRKDNFIQIESYDTVGKFIKGSFTLNLITDGAPSLIYGDTIAFKGVRFEMPIK